MQIKRFGFIGVAAVCFALATILPSFASSDSHLPKGKPSKEMKIAFSQYLDTIKQTKADQHSIMILQHGKIIFSAWMNGESADKPHVMWSVSKTFTSLAVGFAITEGKLKLTDKVISFFPDKLPSEISDNLKALEIRHLLTMNSGHDTDPTGSIADIFAPNTWDSNKDWIRAFFEYPIIHQPGTYFAYNTMGTYVLSAIVQKVTGQKVFDYLTPRLFAPLDITGIHWDESCAGINCGGWGLYLKTEDMAKVGQFLLQKGKWKGKQLIPAAWIEEASKKQVESYPTWAHDEIQSRSDWLQGYGYQIWRCQHNAYRADGAKGQAIIVVPDKDAVIVLTAYRSDPTNEFNQIWKIIFPAL